MSQACRGETRDLTLDSTSCVSQSQDRNDRQVITYFTLYLSACLCTPKANSKQHDDNGKNNRQKVEIWQDHSSNVSRKPHILCLSSLCFICELCNISMGICQVIGLMDVDWRCGIWGWFLSYLLFSSHVEWTLLHSRDLVDKWTWLVHRSFNPWCVYLVIFVYFA